MCVDGDAICVGCHVGSEDTRLSKYEEKREDMY